MKKCSCCSFENPSKANFCLNCGAALGDEILSEEIQLKKKLEEANATIDVLRQSLSIAQQQLENNGSTEELQLLQNQIEEKELEIQNLKDALEKTASDLSETKQELEEIAKLPKKGGKWGWFFVILSIVTIGVVVYLLLEQEKLNSEVNSLNFKNSDLSYQNSEYEEQYQLLKSQMADDEKKMGKIVSTYPLIITNIEIANSDYDRNIETDYGYTLYSNRAMYLMPRIKYNGLTSKNLTFRIKWYNPDGTLRTGRSSPGGCTQSFSRYIYAGDNQLELVGWGNSTPGVSWDRGTYRLEIWVGDICLKSKTVTIY